MKLTILIILQNSELCPVEAKLSLQQQIYIAAHRLCHEEHLSKAVKKSRVQQCKREEQKLKELQDSVFQLRLEHSHSSPRPSIITQKCEDPFSQWIQYSWLPHLKPHWYLSLVTLISIMSYITFNDNIITCGFRSWHFRKQFIVRFCSARRR